MTFISGGRRRAISFAAATRMPMTYAGGVTVFAPDGNGGPAHIIGESPNFPLGIADIDLSEPDEQVMTMSCGGGYVVDSILVHGHRGGSPAGCELHVATLDQARDGGRELVGGLDLGALSDPKAAVNAPVSVPFVLKAPHLYLRLGPLGTGTARVCVYGRVVTLDDPQARSYDRVARWPSGSGPSDPSPPGGFDFLTEGGAYLTETGDYLIEGED